MRDSTYPEILSMADNLGLIIFMLWSTILFGLLSILNITYHVATKKSDIGFYLSFLINLFMIILAFLIVNRYFSVIDYINKVDMIYLSSPFPFFSYTFISLIGSIVFLSITGIYGGFITIMILKDFKEMGIFIRRKNKIHSIVQQIKDSQTNLNDNLSENISGLYNITKNSSGLTANHNKEEEEKELNFLEKVEKKSSRAFSFGESDEEDIEDDKKEKDIESDIEEKRESKPFSFNDIKKKTNNNYLDYQVPENNSSNDSNDSSIENNNVDLNGNSQKTIQDEKSDSTEINPEKNLKISVDLESKVNENIDNKTEKIIEKKFKTVICPQCKQIFSVEKSVETSIVKCPNCGKEGNIG
jgi:hypothetical protein